MSIDWTGLRARAIAAAPTLIRDAGGMLAAVSVAHGAGMVYAPAGWIVGGLLGLAGVWLHARGSGG